MSLASSSLAGSSSDISIRGMASQYTLFLVNGKRISTRGTRPNSDNSGIEQGWLPPLESIERIEVIRGPMSSLYGSDAMGGVINVITKKCRILKPGPALCTAMPLSRKTETPAIFTRPTPMHLDH